MFPLPEAHVPADGRNLRVFELCRVREPQPNSNNDRNNNRHSYEEEEKCAYNIALTQKPLQIQRWPRNLVGLLIVDYSSWSLFFWLKVRNGGGGSENMLEDCCYVGLGSCGLKLFGPRHAFVLPSGIVFVSSAISDWIEYDA